MGSNPITRSISTIAINVMFDGMSHKGSATYRFPSFADSRFSPMLAPSQASLVQLSQGMLNMLDFFAEMKNG